MSDSAYTILIAEDDDSIRHALTDVLTASGYEVLALEEGLAAIHAVRERNFDLALLDVAMPGADGFQVLQAMSEERPGTPVIMLTARGEEEDRVQGLKLGADDYIVKPFSIRELLARIEAVLRRSPERPRQLREIRNLSMKTARRVRDYMDWYEINTRSGTGKTFASYAAAVKILREQEQPANTPVSRYLDDIEKLYTLPARAPVPSLHGKD